MRRVCGYCGRELGRSGRARFCGEACRREWERVRRSGGGGRRCHDCGRETWDYRCPACRAAFRRRHGVAEEGEYGEDFVYA